MRLSPEQVESVLSAVQDQAGGEAHVYLFGSRLDDRSRGGDVDLLVETASPLTLVERARLKLQLEARLQLPVDLIVRDRGAPPTPFQRLVRARAVALRMPS